MSETATEYSKALFELALDENKDHEIYSEVSLIFEILQDNGEYISLLSSPSIPLSQRMALIDECFSKRICEYLVSFMKLIVESGHTNELTHALYEYKTHYFRHHGIVRATVTCAHELSEEDKSRIEKALSVKLEKKIDAVYITDRHLIGGIRAEANGQLFENSIRSRLDTLRSTIDLTSIH